MKACLGTFMSHNIFPVYTCTSIINYCVAVLPFADLKRVLMILILKKGYVTGINNANNNTDNAYVHPDMTRCSWFTSTKFQSVLTEMELLAHISPPSLNRSPL